MARQSWPNSGFLDFTKGESRISTELSSIESLITGSLQDVVANQKQLEETQKAALRVLLGRSVQQAAQNTDVLGGIPDSELAAKVLAEARRLIGVPYMFGATPSVMTEVPTAIDCSAFTQYVFKRAAGIQLPRVSIDQGKQGTLVKEGTITAEEIKSLPMPGDLIFFDGTQKARAAGVISHVGICIGDSTGKIIHASSSKGVVEVGFSDYYSSHFHSIKRILPVTVATSGGASGNGSPLDITNGNAISVGELRTLLGVIKNGSKLMQYADQILNAGVTFGVNPLFSIAQSAYETGWWTSSAFTELNNIGGLSNANHHYAESGITGRSTSGRRWETFNSPGDSFQAKMWLIARHGYFNEGRTTILKVIEKYAPSVENDVARYVQIVEDNMIKFCQHLNIDPNQPRNARQASAPSRQVIG